ncbi:hypothetical protein HanXRQr2_Chr12g0538651 [Helianthus annuus]|uniref:Uncharacterized protein n=1 Tax=Helianthus annuus TaxID=4232 RepID=A0A9K3HG56_HELAN|nr:hypothetical protein HanXRQr2_Chr12g0538651 [Helianthus annuus]KAJ0862458.1 hypothetical protein HanPSC8_Chr12g0518471 [Helianthus annuus]
MLKSASTNSNHQGGDYLFRVVGQETSLENSEPSKSERRSLCQELCRMKTVR